jgi:hypothetical protein
VGRAGELWNSVFSRKATPKQAADLANATVQKALGDAYATLSGWPDASGRS